MIEFDEDFDVIFQEFTSEFLLNTEENDQFEFDFFQPTPSTSEVNQISRSIDYPSTKEHYGLLSFYEWKIPIIYRLLDEQFYTPYVAFPFVLNVFDHPTYRNSFVNVRNLPLVEMTEIERKFYEKLISSPIDSDWSKKRMLSVSMLDSILLMIDSARNFDSTTNVEENLIEIRQKIKEKWFLTEKLVEEKLKREQENCSICLKQTTIGERRSFFEQRLELSICEQTGGFIQIDEFIYPFVKHKNIYLNLKDIVKNLRSFSFYREPSIKNEDFEIIKRNFDSLIELNQLNRIRADRRHFLNKFLIFDSNDEQNSGFVSILNVLEWFRRSTFVQIFENSTPQDIESSYKDRLGRQFILGWLKNGAIINGTIPCFVDSNKNIWISTERPTERPMTNDERLFFNMILIHRALWKNLLNKKRKFYLQQINENQENLRIEFIFKT